MTTQPNNRSTGDPAALVDHLFRTKSGELVARLTSIFGLRRLDLAEDVVQEALLSALKHWSYYGIPESPVGWLITAARNKALDHLRREKTFAQKTEDIAEAIRTALPEKPESGFAHEIADSQLRLMFVLCDPSLTPASQQALILKTLGGFSVAEIARAFLAKEPTIAQRLVRARKTLADQQISFEIPADQLDSRLETVLQVIYLLFNEGYNAYEGDNLVRFELVNEALRYCSLLVNHPLGEKPKCFALMSLLSLQASRLPSRVDAESNLVLLADQDRTKWDQRLIAQGFHYLEKAASGEEVTTYHLEAGIAACHAMAKDYDSTDWPQILEYYNRLVDLLDSPVIALNRAVAIAMVDSPQAGLAALDNLADNTHLQQYYLLYATRGELLQRLGQSTAAIESYRTALSLTQSTPERRFLEHRITTCQSTSSRD